MYCMPLARLQLIFHVQLNPMPRGKGYFTALLKRGAGRVFGEDFCEGLTNESCRCWRTRSLPLCAKVILVSKSRVWPRRRCTATGLCLRNIRTCRFGFQLWYMSQILTRHTFIRRFPRRCLLSFLEYIRWVFAHARGTVSRLAVQEAAHYKHPQPSHSTDRFSFTSPYKKQGLHGRTTL